MCTHLVVNHGRFASAKAGDSRLRREAGVKKRERNSRSLNTRPISLNEKNGISAMAKMIGAAVCRGFAAQIAQLGYDGLRTKH
jgi:hypothetical protein